MLETYDNLLMVLIDYIVSRYLRYHSREQNSSSFQSMAQICSSAHGPTTFQYGHSLFGLLVDLRLNTTLKSLASVVLLLVCVLCGRVAS